MGVNNKSPAIDNSGKILESEIYANALICRSCGWRSHEDLNIYMCPKCGAPLDLEYRKGREIPEPRDILKCRDGIWCFSQLLPRYRYKATLGEGMTRIVDLVLGRVRAMAKMESQNPTGSFKDRGAALAVSMAISIGAKAIVEDSSGNAGIATACYSRAHSVSPIIVVPSTAPKGKIDLIRLCGAEIVIARDREQAALLAPKIALERSGAYLPHTWLPHHIEGMKTMAFEIHYQVEDLPDAIFIPTSSGTLLLGLYMGFKELVSLGYRKRVPKLIAVQTRSFHPIYAALKGEELEPEGENLADGISIKNPPRLGEIVSAIRESGGDAMVVSNQEIRGALKELVARGVIVEPTSAVSLAGLMRSIEMGSVFENPMVILTGSGLKVAQRVMESI